MAARAFAMPVLAPPYACNSWSLKAWLHSCSLKHPIWRLKTVRICTYECPLSAHLRSTSSLLRDICRPSSPLTNGSRRQWHGDSKVIAIVNTEAEWECTEGPSCLPAGSLPLKLVVLTGDIQRHLPETLHVEATGPGGEIFRILSLGIYQLERTKKVSRSTDHPWHPGGNSHLQVSALGRSKAEHIAVIVEDPQCGDERQAWGNCLPTATAGHSPGTSCSPSFAL